MLWCHMFAAAHPLSPTFPRLFGLSEHRTTPSNPCLFCKFRTLFALPTPKIARNPCEISSLHTLPIDNGGGGRGRTRSESHRSKRLASPSCFSLHRYLVTSLLQPFCAKSDELKHVESHSCAKTRGVGSKSKALAKLNVPLMALGGIPLGAHDIGTLVDAPDRIQ